MYQPGKQTQEHAQKDRGRERKEHRCVPASPAEVPGKPTKRKVKMPAECDQRAGDDQQDTEANQKATKISHNSIGC